MSEKQLVLSQSGITTFLHCRRKWHWVYEENLVRKGTSRPLQVGQVVHRLFHMDNVNELTFELLANVDQLVEKLFPDNDAELSQSVAEEAVGLFVGYKRRFASEPLEVVASETIIEVDIGYCTLHARVDALARAESGRLRRVEHKTTSRFTADYLNGVTKGLQNALYDFASREVLNEPIEGTTFNLLVKTKIPQFHRTFVPYNQGNVDRMLEVVKGVCRSIEREDLYPSMQCYTYNRECEYKILCEHDSPASRSFFVKRESPIHQPLTEEEETS